MTVSTLINFCVSKSDTFNCQDACADDPSRGRFAVADGVSLKSFMSGYFAKRLVDLFVAAPDATLDDIFRTTPDDGEKRRLKIEAGASSSGLNRWAEELKTRWREDVRGIHLRRINPNRRPDWTDGHLRSHSTFAGVRIREAGAGYDMDVMVVGDCFVFLFDDERTKPYMVTMAKLEGRDDHPAMVTVGNDDSVPVFQSFKIERLTAAPGTYVAIATDRLGWWLLGKLKSNRWQDVITPFSGLRQQSDFENWVLDLRARQELGEGEDDDVTLMLIRLDPVDAAANAHVSREKPADVSSEKSIASRARELMATAEEHQPDIPVKEIDLAEPRIRWQTLDAVSLQRVVFARQAARERAERERAAAREQADRDRSTRERAAERELARREGRDSSSWLGIPRWAWLLAVLLAFVITVMVLTGR